ncbi:MAG: hypothetical protein Q4Q53_04135, partial [Methanocorpusculum sp.]|nr:hypothetical protein [Methanocorpusculum sp.]
IIPLLMAVFQFLNGPTGVSTELWLAVTAIISVVSLYFALAVSSEKISLPLGKTLKSDVETDFKKSGSVLGYLLFGLSCASYAFYYLSGTTEAYTNYLALDSVVGFMLIVTGILLFAVGKMRFTPVMFIIMGFVTITATNLGNQYVYVPLGIALIILGIIALLRTESRILPAVMLVVYGFTFETFSLGLGDIPILQGVLNLIPCLIAVYLAFAVFSQSKKLKLF